MLPPLAIARIFAGSFDPVDAKKEKYSGAETDVGALRVLKILVQTAFEIPEVGFEISGRMVLISG